MKFQLFVVAKKLKHRESEREKKSTTMFAINKKQNTQNTSLKFN